MNIISWFIEFVMHLDKHLTWLITQFGGFSYLILFLIIFCETGFVIAPFLPGDSLLFASGALASNGIFNIWLLFPVFALASILGDSANYAIGHFIGKKVFSMKSKLIKKEYLERTEMFYEKYGGKAIVLARFFPILRTFAPFLAGVARMSYFKFLIYNIVGGLAWVCLFLFGGYFFGTIPFVQNNFSLTIVIIIVVSSIPAVVEYLKHRARQKKKKQKK